MGRWSTSNGSAFGVPLGGLSHAIGLRFFIPSPATIVGQMIGPITLGFNYSRRRPNSILPSQNGSHHMIRSE
jgi:hypothetical protein